MDLSCKNTARFLLTWMVRRRIKLLNRWLWVVNRGLPTVNYALQNYLPSTIKLIDVWLIKQQLFMMSLLASARPFLHHLPWYPTWKPHFLGQCPITFIKNCLGHEAVSNGVSQKFHFKWSILWTLLLCIFTKTMGETQLMKWRTGQVFRGGT